MGICTAGQRKIITTFSRIRVHIYIYVYMHVCVCACTFWETWPIDHRQSK